MAPPPPPTNPLPVTLLSGFLGAGKTTLLRHILTSPCVPYRIAVVVNDMAALNIDAALLAKHVVPSPSPSPTPASGPAGSQKGSGSRMIQLQNGCICCTLRGDLLEALVEIATRGEAEYVVIESTGVGEPMQVAETFTEEFAGAMRGALMVGADDGGDGEDGGAAADGSAMITGDADGLEVLKKIEELGGLHRIVRLDTLVTMVDAYNFFENFETTEFISGRWGEREQVAEEDERTVTDLMVDQIEFANVIVVNKLDCVSEEVRKRIRGLLAKLNPKAKVIEARYAQVDIREVLATEAFDFEKAATSMGWLQSLHEMSKREVNGVVRFAPKPETEEYGISSIVYRARRPFHPKRLYRMIHDIFVLMEDAEDAEGEEEDVDSDADMDNGDSKADGGSDDGPSTDGAMSSDGSWGDEDEDEDVSDADDLSEGIDPKTVADNKRRDPDFRGLLRSKGFVWLATRPLVHGAWSQAGTMLTLQGGEQWFCTLDEDHWPPGEETKKSILADFMEPWGDRRQELVLIGEKMNSEALTARFDACLLTDVEMKKWERIMRTRKGPEVIQEKLDNAFEDGFQDWAIPDSADDEHDHGHDHHHSHDHAARLDGKLKR